MPILSCIFILFHIDIYVYTSEYTKCFACLFWCCYLKSFIILQRNVNHLHCNHLLLLMKLFLQFFCSNNFHFLCNQFEVFLVFEYQQTWDKYETQIVVKIFLDITTDFWVYMESKIQYETNIQFKCNLLHWRSNVFSSIFIVYIICRKTNLPSQSLDTSFYSHFYSLTPNPVMILQFIRMKRFFSLQL